MYMAKTFKLLRCHPKKTRKNNSCYDDNTILLLKEEWNKKNVFTTYYHNMTMHVAYSPKLNLYFWQLVSTIDVVTPQLDKMKAMSNNRLL